MSLLAGNILSLRTCIKSMCIKSMLASVALLAACCLRVAGQAVVVRGSSSTARTCTVPAGVTAVDVKLWGAAGRSGQHLESKQWMMLASGGSGAAHSIQPLRRPTTWPASRTVSRLCSPATLLPAHAAPKMRIQKPKPTITHPDLAEATSAATPTTSSTKSSTKWSIKSGGKSFDHAPVRLGATPERSVCPLRLCTLCPVPCRRHLPTKPRAAALCRQSASQNTIPDLFPPHPPRLRSFPLHVLPTVQASAHMHIRLHNGAMDDVNRALSRLHDEGSPFAAS